MEEVSQIKYLVYCLMKNFLEKNTFDLSTVGLFKTIQWFTGTAKITELC